MANEPIAFQMIAGNPALDLVNTLDNRFAERGPLELLETYADLLRFAVQARLIAAPEADALEHDVKRSQAERALRLAHRLRESLAAVLYSILDRRHPGGQQAGAPDVAELRDLDKIVREAMTARKLRWTHTGENAALGWIWPVGDAELPVWKLAVSAADLLTSQAMEHLQACNVDTCRWLFLDTSKNRSRRWCDMKVCGNRMKARRFQAAAKR